MPSERRAVGNHGIPVRGLKLPKLEVEIEKRDRSWETTESPSGD